MSDERAETDQSQRPVLRVVRGDPDDTELAALAAALAGTATSGGATPEPPRRLSLWADRSAALRHPGGRRPLEPGPNAWRASALPL